jgi:hypothetical protein
MQTEEKPAQILAYFRKQVQQEAKHLRNLRKQASSPYNDWQIQASERVLRRLKAILKQVQNITNPQNS